MGRSKGHSLAKGTASAIRSRSKAVHAKHPTGVYLRGTRLQPGKGRYCLSPFTAPDSRHNLRPGTTLRRGAARRVCQRVLTRPGKGRYCLPPCTTKDSRHNLRPGTTLSRGAAGRVCAGLMPVQPSPPVGRSAAAAAPGKRSAVKEAPPRISLASVPPMSPL